MAEKHASDLRDYQKKLLGKEIRPKFSRDLLNLRKIQDTLGNESHIPLLLTHLLTHSLKSQTKGLRRSA